jgi:hypothetical protein
MISVIDNLVRTFPVSFFGIEFCITMAKTLLGKSQTLTCGEGHQEPIACRRIHENPYIGTIETRQDIFKTRVSSSSRPRRDTDRESNDIRISSSSELRSRSSGVSMWSRVPDFLSHMMDTEEPILPHSSGTAPLSVPWAFNQHDVTIAPSKFDSTRYLFSSEDRDKSSGGMKSHGRTTKSRCIRLEKCLSTAHVPTGSSGDSSYVWTSTWRDGYDDEDVSE